MAFHCELTGLDIHVINTWTYANSAAREAATGFVSDDVYKVAVVTDDDSIWMLVDHSPITWQQLGGVVVGEIDHCDLDNLLEDCHTQYMPTDASRAFTQPVCGAPPTIGAHLATKAYVDGEIVSDHGDLTGLLDVADHPGYSTIDGSRAYTAPVSGQDPTLDNHLATKSYTDSKSPSGHGHSIQSGVQFQMAPHFDGEIPLVGFYVQTDSAESLSVGVSATMSTPTYAANVVVEVTGAVGTPFNMKFFGTRIIDATGALVPNTTETISITGNGWYQTNNTWVDAVQIGVQSGSCTVDIYRAGAFAFFNEDISITGLVMQWTPSAPAWSMEWDIYKVNSNGSLTTIDSQSHLFSDIPPRAGGAGEPGRVGQLITPNVEILGSSDEGFVVVVNQEKIFSFFMEIFTQRDEL